MTISSASNTYAVQQIYATKNIYSSTGTTQANATTSSSAASNVSSGSNSSGSIDFTNMTESQFGSLVASGKIKFPDGFMTPIMKLPQGIGTSSGEHYQDDMTSFNYIKRYSDEIGNSKITGFDTTNMQNVLNQIKALQGGSYPKKVDSYA
jgi:hypothetical protein